MGEKKELVQAVLEELPDVFDAYLPKYLKKHRTELKRWLLNTDGFRSEEEFEAVEKENARCEAQVRDLNERLEHLVEERNNARRSLEAARADAERSAQNLELVKREAERRVQQAQAECDNRTNELYERSLVMEQRHAELQQALEELRGERNRLAETYGRAENVVARYQALPATARQGLAPLLGDGGDGLTLVVRLAKLENFQSLWDYAATLLVRDTLSAKEAAALTALVDDSLALVNASHATPPLDVKDIPTGARYLPTTMQKTPASHQQGAVTRVLLKGCAYAGSGNCLRKPLVVVE